MSNKYPDVSDTEFLRVFINALKRQIDMKLSCIEMLLSPDFAERLIDMLEKTYDECS